MVSMAVIALHTLYLVLLVTKSQPPAVEMASRSQAYAFYVVNAAQFVYKLRRARLDAATPAFPVDGRAA